MIELIGSPGRSGAEPAPDAEGGMKMQDIELRKRRYAAADSAAGGIAILKDRLLGAIERLRRRRPIRARQASIRSPNPG